MISTKSSNTCFSKNSYQKRAGTGVEDAMSIREKVAHPLAFALALRNRHIPAKYLGWVFALLSVQSNLNLRPDCLRIHLHQR